MSISLKLSPEVEARAIAEANARGLAVEQFLKSVIERELSGYSDREETASEDLSLTDIEYEKDPYMLPPTVINEAERRSLLKELVEEMKRHSITGNPPRITREELHERR
jgi:hypothetical protein